MSSVENKRLKIGFLHSLYAQNSEKASWRQTNKYIIESLQQHCGDVVSLDPIRIPELRLEGRTKQAGQILFQKNLTLYNTIYVGRRYGLILSKRLKNSGFDFIFASSGWTETSFVQTDIPIVLLEDASFASIHNYYPEYSELFSWAYRDARMVSERAIAKARLILYPSQWAARSAIESYQLDPTKVFVAPWGANSKTPPISDIFYHGLVPDVCKLLFVGMDWNRKGGAIAYETLLELEKLGVRAELIVCGCVPPAEFRHPEMRIIPYLSKNDPRQLKELENLYKTSDLFFMPTRSECYGCVFCEASSYGLPVISTNTGGVSGAVINGENGFLLPLEARGPEYARLIAAVFQDKQRYAALVRSSRAAFEQRLNWDSWGKSVNLKIRESLSETKQPVLANNYSNSTTRAM